MAVATSSTAPATIALGTARRTLDRLKRIDKGRRNFALSDRGGELIRLPAISVRARRLAIAMIDAEPTHGGTQDERLLSKGEPSDDEVRMTSETEEVDRMVEVTRRRWNEMECLEAEAECSGKEKEGVRGVQASKRCMGHIYALTRAGRVAVQDGQPGPLSLRVVASFQSAKLFRK